MWDRNTNHDASNANSFSDIEASNNQNENDYDSGADELSLEYLPNELKYRSDYHNDEAETILNGSDNQNKNALIEFFRGITLCHQINVNKDIK
jgi:hypothetical protein